MQLESEQQESTRYKKASGLSGRGHGGTELVWTGLSWTGHCGRGLQERVRWEMAWRERAVDLGRRGLGGRRREGRGQGWRKR